MKLILVCLALVFAAPLGVRADTLRLAFENYPPYEYVEDGQVKGTSARLVNNVCKRLGLTPQYVFEPFARALYNARGGDVDGLFSLFKNPERQEFLYYPFEPLGETVLAIVGRDDTTIEITSLEDLRPYSIGVVRGYSHGPEFDSLTGLNKTEVASNTLLLRMLGTGRVDVAVCNRDVLLHTYCQDKYNWKVKVLKVLSREPLYIGFSKALGARGCQLVKDFDRELKSIREGR